MDNEAMLLQVMVLLIVILAAARLGGLAFRSQPPVVGEIATGLLLGPPCFGRLSPDFSA